MGLPCAGVVLKLVDVVQAARAHRATLTAIHPLRQGAIGAATRLSPARTALSVPGGGLVRDVDLKETIPNDNVGWQEV